MNSDVNTLIVGYDIDNEYTQISCDSNSLMIPTVLFLSDHTKEWFFGEEAMKMKNHKQGYYVDNILEKLKNSESVMIDDADMSSDAVLEKFFQRTLTILRQKYNNNGILKMVVTTKDLNDEIRMRLCAIFHNLGLMEDRVRIVSHTECFMYYVLSQKSEIWTNDVGLFDLDENGLQFYQLTIGRRKNPAPVIASHYDLGKEFPYSILQDEDEERMKYYFETLTYNLLHKRIISTLYFTGKGFNGNWSDDILKKLCVGRRVFKGQNLYTVGACYMARAIHEESFKEFFFLSEERISSTISMKVYKDARDAQVIMAKAGEYYYDIDSSVHIILEDEDSLDFTINNLIKKDDIHAFLNLQGLPDREKRTIRLLVSLTFADRNTAIIKVKDLGFGEFYKTSYRIWEFRLDL